MKTIDLNKPVYELVQAHPELVDILSALGFHEITKKALLNTVGRKVTLPFGAQMLGLDMEVIKETFRKNGFHMEDAADDAARARTEALKSYLRRLGEGEALESVRADFVEAFREVHASEIMAAEQEMIAEGTPLEEVQRLCDLHSALFHGATREERIAQADEAVRRSLQAQAEPDASADVLQRKMETTTRLISIKGHPLSMLTAENEALAPLLKDAREALESGKPVNDLLSKIREISVHYAKKGDLLYPHLNVYYGISGPSNVMWTVDDEIRDELAELTKSDAPERDRVEAVLVRVEEMIYKEANILFPICAEHFTEEDWKSIYRDSKDYATCLGVEEVWEKAEGDLSVASSLEAGEIVLPGGRFTVEQLTALLNTIPLEITFVDAEDINRFFNEGPKVFKRPMMALGRDVFSCHPPKVEPMVRSIINDFRSGKRDQVPVWMNKQGRTMLVTYMAVRDAEGQYLGTMELVQDMEFAKEHFNR